MAGGAPVGARGCGPERSVSVSRDTQAVMVFAAVLAGFVIVARGELGGICFVACALIVLVFMRK